jgi:hypothetical protein
MLLAVLDMIGSGDIVVNEIPYSDNLVDRFTAYFSRVSEKDGWCQPAPPFFHLRSSSFWKHAVIAGRENEYASLTTSGGGSKRILDNIEYAYFDESAWTVVSNPKQRKRLQRAIISEFFPREYHSGLLEEAKLENKEIEKEDVHFLIDNAQPQEVLLTLRSLDESTAKSSSLLREKLASEWRYRAQKHLDFTTRRLVDLGLAQKVLAPSNSPGYFLTHIGRHLQGIADAAPDLYREAMHYLHYSLYDGTPTARKLLWSYRVCTDLTWGQKQMLPASEIVSHVLSRIEREFPLAYVRRVGGNFNEGGVTSGWKPWIVQLTPSVIGTDGVTIVPRHTNRYELVLLAVDDVYRARGYRYGDPVLLDDELLDDIARVFFLDHACCRELIDIAARLTRTLTLSDTLAGTALTLTEPYGIERL